MQIKRIRTEAVVCNEKTDVFDCVHKEGHRRKSGKFIKMRVKGNHPRGKPRSGLEHITQAIIQNDGKNMKTNCG